MSPQTRIVLRIMYDSLMCRDEPPTFHVYFEIDGVVYRWMATTQRRMSVLHNVSDRLSARASAISEQAEWVIDPFCGRGSTNYVARLLGLPTKSDRRHRRRLERLPYSRRRRTRRSRANRPLFDDWLRRAYKLAKIVPQRREMWHSIRRRWATERKGYPVKDVAAADGSKTEEVLVTSYQQADAETIKNVVLHPTARIVSR
jgi:hypothetical protein